MSRIIIDVREPFEYATSHIDEALNIPMGKFENGTYKKKLKGVSHDDEIVLYCRSGGRAGTCAVVMATDGYTNVKNGINEASIRQAYNL